jgi:hypothetical protein
MVREPIGLADDLQVDHGCHSVDPVYFVVGTKY